jgi:hypothetical protein
MPHFTIFLGLTWFYGMKVVASIVFRVIHFPREGNITTIDQLDYCTPDLRANPSTNIPFIVNYSTGYESVDIGMFKDPFIKGIFLLPAPNTTHIAPINMILSSTREFLGSINPWVVPHPKDIDSNREYIPSTFIDNGKQIHPYVEFDKKYMPVQVVDSLSSHDFLYRNSPTEEAISEVGASIDNPIEDKKNHTFLLIAS